MTRAQGSLTAKTLFLSDIHLGFKRARARELATFLRNVDAETIVLAGDIVDHLNLSRRIFWNDEHTQVVRTLLAKRRAGTRLIYIPGNHDSDLSLMAELLSGQVEVHREWVHRTARGERLLVVHGDQFDSQMEHACPRWMSWLGNAFYDFTVMANDRVNDVGRVMGRPYWPLAEKLKLSIGSALRYIERFEQVAVAYAAEHGFDGILCGHIHRANLRHFGQTLYCNTGDWVETCSAVVEEPGGELRLRRWSHATQPHVDHGGVRVGAGRAQGFGYDRLRLSIDRALHAPE
jgi:UDP-2,3-diacylglucosamine pyrophosphatase LpxH